MDTIRSLNYCTVTQTAAFNLSLSVYNLIYLLMNTPSEGPPKGSPESVVVWWSGSAGAEKKSKSCYARGVLITLNLVIKKELNNILTGWLSS